MRARNVEKRLVALVRSPRTAKTASDHHLLLGRADVMRGEDPQTPDERGTRFDRVVVLGVGAQKAGTSWFYDHLSQSPEFRPGIRREYHVFDSIDIPEQDYARDRITEQARDALTHADPGPAQSRALLRAAMLADPTAYFDHFATLFTRSH